MATEERGAATTSGERLVIWTRALGALDSARPFAEATSSRFLVAGGELLGELGCSVTVAFEGFDAIEACQIAMERLGSLPDDVDCAMGAAFGEIEVVAPGVARGEPLDRAQWLCHRAGRGDLVVDDAARALLAEFYLFTAPIGEEAGARRGHPIDRGAPTVPECRAGVARLKPPALPAAYLPFVDTLTELSAAPGRSVLLARGSSAALIDAPLERTARSANPAIILPLGPVPLGLEPLGSLRYGLTRLFPLGSELDEARDGLSDGLREALHDVRAGRPVDLALAAKATAELLGARAEGRGKAWIVVDPLPALDVSTARLLRSLAESGPDLLIACRVPNEVAVPADAFGRAPVVSLELPGLGDGGACFAASMLGVDESAEIASLVAALGGSTPLGVIEAARTLVSRGDIVYADARFDFRQRVKPRKGSVPLSRLLAERLRDLETNALRVLEVVALCPPGTPRAVLAHALELDGLGEATRRAAAETLEREAWITGGHVIVPSSEPARASVLKAMAPARRVELQSFIAQASSDFSNGAFAQVASAAHARAAGESEGPAAVLIEAAEEAKAKRHVRAALKLAATAVEWSRSSEIRRRAAEVARAEPPPEGAESAPRDERASLSTRWVAALRARDFELADRLIDEGVAEGAPLVTAETLRTWMALMRGDAPLARELAGSAWDSSEHASQPRLALVSAWIELVEKKPREAMARSLAVLASARRGSDKAAEGAALATLSACFVTLDRTEDASVLGQLAEEAASLSRSLRSKSA
jgi:hypothetical protein